MLKNAVTYFDYDKLSDDLFFLGGHMVLRLNVSLNKVNPKDGTRISSYKEYKYSTSKYSDVNQMITMRRSFDYYLTIDKLDMREMSVMIRVQDILLLRAKVNEALSWFNDGTFGMKNKRLYVIRKPQPSIVSGLIENKSIIFEPIVIEWENDGVQEQGIRVTLTESVAYTDIPIGRFYGFAYLINSVNMYESAQLLLNYLGSPEMGSNLITFEENPYLSDNNQNQKVDLNSVKTRSIPDNKPNRSFFDKIDDLG